MCIRDSKYSVPYTWGTVGIIYNTKYVDKADVTGWELLWNEKYAGKILMFDNSRDAFGIAEYLLGYDVHTTDDAELQALSLIHISIRGSIGIFSTSQWISIFVVILGIVVWVWRKTKKVEETA